MKFVYELMIYSIFILLFFFIGTYGQIEIEKQTAKHEKILNSIDDMIKCPETAKYFNLFKSNYNSWKLSIWFFGYSMIIMLIFLILINLSFNLNANPYLIILISIFIAFYVFFCVYKSQNCLLYRLCPKGCVQPLLSKMK